MYPKAAFVHYAAHRHNLVVNDLNTIAEVHNSKSTPKHGAWSQMFLCYVKHDGQPSTKASESSPTTEDIHKQLGILVTTASGKTSQDTHKLQCAPGTSTLLLCLVIMAKYSTMVPVTQVLQAVQFGVLNVHGHIQQLLVIFKTHRKEARWWRSIIVSQYSSHTR